MLVSPNFHTEEFVSTTNWKPLAEVDEMTCTIPANRLAEVVQKLEARKTANATVSTYANQDARRFGKG